MNEEYYDREIVVELFPLLPKHMTTRKVEQFIVSRRYKFIVKALALIIERHDTDSKFAEYNFTVMWEKINTDLYASSSFNLLSLDIGDLREFQKEHDEAMQRIIVVSYFISAAHAEQSELVAML